MTPTQADQLPPLLFPAATSTERRWLGKLRSTGKIRAIGPRLYSSVPDVKVDAVVRGSWATIVSKLFPDALLSHRTALEYRPSPDGEVFLTGGTNREVKYPGLTLRFTRGPAPLADDPKFLTIRASSLSRALLENLATTRPEARSKTVPIEEVERRLEQQLHAGGEAALNALRDRAQSIAAAHGWAKAFDRLDGLIGALLGTHSKQKVTSVVALARAAGEPFDPRCLERLQLLFGELRIRSLPPTPDRFAATDHFSSKAFFESYFSNYIEGTTFELEEAEKIVFEKRIPESRPKDAHDILGTFRVVSDVSEMRRTPGSFDEFRKLLVARHTTMLEKRPEAEPGAFKTKPNRAGDTHFVHPEYVVGTLRKGFELYLDLPAGFSRAAFMMFLVAEVHPFVDGNGRISRLMMNSELVSAREATIIIPTVYREDYLLSLRALTRRDRPTSFVDMLRRAQLFSNLEFSPYRTVLQTIQSRNWFRNDDEAKIID